MQEQPEPVKRGDTGKRGDPGWPPSPRQILGLIILVLVLVFALVNLEDVKIDFVFGEVTIPIFFVITVPALIGFLAGVLFQHHRSRRARD